MKNTKVIFLIAVIISGLFILDLILLNYFAPNTSIGNQNPNSAQGNNNGTSLSSSLNPGITLTLAEVAKHNTQTDCWMVINNKIYDVGSYMNSHPGGNQELLRGCGLDATSLFNTKGQSGGSSHSSTAQSLLAAFYLGDLNQQITSSELTNKTSTIASTNIPKISDDDEEEEDEYEYEDD